MCPLRVRRHHSHLTSRQTADPLSGKVRLLDAQVGQFNIEQPAWDEVVPVRGRLTMSDQHK